MFIPYSDFIVYEGASIEQQMANKRMRENRTLETLIKHSEKHPEWDSKTPYDRFQMKEWFSSNTIEAAKKHGYIDNS